MEQTQKQNFLINIKVKTLNGSFYQFSVNPDEPIASIQIQIEQKAGVPIINQRIIFRGVLLQFQRSFHFYNIQQGQILQLIANRIPSQFSSKNSSHQRSTISRNGPTYTQDQYKYKKHRYLQQRINGFKLFNNAQALQVLAQNKHTIDQLLQCVNLNGHQITPFKLQKWTLMTGEWIDIRDASGQWVQGQILSHYGQYVHIHFNGYSDRWNQWVPVGSERIMPFRSFTVQSEISDYLSPCPNNPRKIQKKENKKFYPQLEKFITELTHTIDSVNKLMKEMQFQQKSQKDLSIKNVSAIGANQNQTHCESLSKINQYQVKLQHDLSERQEKQLKKQEFQTPSKDPPTLADNLSNKCEDNDNISNKCDNDDISNKSFKSKRSQGLVDTSSMKSLIIDEQRHKQKQNKIFFDYTQAHSVRSMKNKHHSRFHYINNQEHILEEQDSQYNQDLDDGHLMLFQKMLLERKMKASQLAPMIDRLGRLLIDLAPQVAMLGHTQQINLAQNTNFNENLSICTNQGSLQSKLISLHKRQRGVANQEQQASELNSPTPGYCQFQIPVMLTPIQIARINKLLAMENAQTRNNLN